MHNPMGWGGQYCPGGECLSSMCKTLELTLSTIRKQTELLPRTCVRQASIWTYYTYIHKATHLEKVGKNCMHPYVHSFLFLDFHNDPQHHSILNRKQKWVSSSRWMNCVMLKISQLKYLIMNWEKKKKTLLLQTAVRTNQKEKRSWRENEMKNKIWSGWHIYKTDGLSARYWWIFLQDKNGNLSLKIKQCAADLSGSATPLEYKRLANQDILTRGFTKKEKPIILLAR